MSATVTIDPAQPSERPLLEGLMQFYKYDFSEMAPDGDAPLDFDAQGRFEPYRYLPDYWTEDGRVPLVIRVDGKPAGFALLNRRFHLGAAADRNMAEFFVARRYRRHGVASEAVRLILVAYPGRWEVAVLAYNAGALAFWPRAIAAAPGVTDIVRHDAGGDWPGPVWTFVAG